jgi:excisionase family DNA binding protein
MDQQATTTTQLPPLLVRVNEAARLLGLGRSTIYQLVESGELPSVRIGTARRIPLAALEQWVNERIEKSAY